MESSFDPLGDEELFKLKKEYKVPFIADCLQRYNDRLKARIEENKQKKGYRLNEVPAVENEKLFEAILALTAGRRCSWISGLPGAVPAGTGSGG